ncbi:right-handed parallel beta-helix repeat-containing protein [Methylicorpusculum oleiharenae]|uniref:right-handed parallel beta-helix repeat-containing protein n=1 Tax=Methylicorpusculum oleiharenae TaxID=1338687 RepID=UPI001356915D|nr:right-handed parallel beta-helix repeat-containing protein [Methylicorpusculum oleiharenae]MCD2448863.1 right-handed parallel beta-helix repeat-containing protein [Methylicorpusculum oleiharenae]
MKTLIYVVLTLAALFSFSQANAEIYFVDARNGNDSWNGTSATLSGTNGPWQSISRVNSAILQPGDQVLFSCGQTWYESLKPSGNGTSTAKINFGSYPAHCPDKPKISGFRTIPSDNWQPYQGNIWRTTFPQGLIPNSSLSTTVANWSKWPADASQTFVADCPLSVKGCMDFRAGFSNYSSVAISRVFPIVGSQKYVAILSMFAPNDVSINLIVREHGNKFSPLGLSQKITGTGQWQHLRLEFTATTTLPNARLDIEVPRNKQVYLRDASVYQQDILPKPSSVLFAGDPLTIAHHPNVGHDTANPDSVYLRTSEASPVLKDRNNRQYSNQIMTSDLKLPPGASIDSGTKLRLREVNWRINEYAVSSMGTDTLTISPNTMYPISSAGWGFYFYDDLWMLDSAGEWFFDEDTQTLYVWTPTNQHPGNRVALATLDTAINLDAKNNIAIENLQIDGAMTGVSMQKSANVSLFNMNINNISASAVFARQSTDPYIKANQINRTGLSGVASINAYLSTNAFIENNELSESGVIVKSGKRTSLPMTTQFTIIGGDLSVIAHNSLSYSGGFAISGEQENKIESNIIENACFNINDCGAVYLVTSNSKGSLIQNNLILETSGDLTGTPDLMYRISNGIYLDYGTLGVSIIGNTVKGGTSSLHLHNSSQNTITRNIFYGSDIWLVRQQEDTLAYGNMSGNIINNNQFFPTENHPAINNSFLSTNSQDASKFATYEDNHYATIFTDHVTREINELTDTTSHTLYEWQTATTLNGEYRNNDLNSSSPAPLPFFALGIADSNFISNTDFVTGINGWGSWNAIAPMSTRALEGCLPVSVNCMHVIAGASVTLVNSPKFTITKSKLYRVTFDLQTSVDQANLTALVRFAGPSNYKSLMNKIYKFSSSTEWKRHSFIFEANETASSITVADQGARFDIQGLPAKQSLRIANLEIVPFDPGTLGPTHTNLLVNKTDVDKALDCPTRLSNSKLCSHYFIFPEATAAVWPISVPPRSGRIVFTQNITLIDTDGDGIADSQDQCPGSATGLAVNCKGCSLFD